MCTVTVPRRCPLFNELVNESRALPDGRENCGSCIEWSTHGERCTKQRIVVDLMAKKEKEHKDAERLQKEKGAFRSRARTAKRAKGVAKNVRQKTRGTRSY